MLTAAIVLVVLAFLVAAYKLAADKFCYAWILATFGFFIVFKRFSPHELPLWEYMPGSAVIGVIFTGFASWWKVEQRIRQAQK